MGTLAEALSAALRGFATEVSTWTNQGSLVSIEGHIAQIESAVSEDVHAGETAAKAVLADLYHAFHGQAPAAAAPPAPADTAPAAPSASATGGTVDASTTVLVGESGPETLVPSTPSTVDPTPAPSTTTEASSAPSSTSSDSTADTAAAAPAAADGETPPAVAS